MSDNNRFQEGDTVIVAQDGLTNAPSFEHKQGTVVEADTEVEGGLHRKIPIDNGRGRQGLFEQLLDPTGRRGSTYVEICTHTAPRKHKEATYYVVEFSGGDIGCYPGTSLVPTYETALAIEERVGAVEPEPEQSSEGTTIPIVDPDEEDEETEE